MFQPNLYFTSADKKKVLTIDYWDLYPYDKDWDIPMSQWEENVSQLENGDFEVLYKIDSENLQFLKTGTWELTGIFL